jgi:hypothetical protein
MPLPMPSHLSTSQTLALTALGSAVATTSLILTFQSLRREHRTEKLKRQVGEDVEEWEKSRMNSGVASPEERAETFARGVDTPNGKRTKEWARGEFDEGLIREQVCDGRSEIKVRLTCSSPGITTSWAKKPWSKSGRDMS